MRAPVVVFAYNRADHLQKTLSALSENLLAKETKLFVFVDGPKSEQGKAKQEEVIECVKGFETGYFEEVHTIIAPKNKGLAASVIEGVTSVMNQYGKVIVLEDDAVSSPYYLTFMNEALNYYETDNRVWSIGGFTVPMQLPADYNKDIIVTQRVSSCAWATWKDRWGKIDWSSVPYKKFRFSFWKRRRFNAWGDDRASMYDDQMNQRINSWAIRFDYAMFSNKMFNIIPRNSLIQNIGLDGSGTHSQESAKQHFNVEIVEKKQWEFCDVEIDTRVRKAFCKPFHMSGFDRTKRFWGNLLYKKKK